MRSFTTLFLIFYVNVVFSQAPITSLQIEPLMVDSTLNCRALEIHEDRVYIATSDSRVMVLEDGASVFKSVWPADTINKPHYRSLAITHEGVFALGIGSPALLYKNGRIVYSENDENAFYDAMEFWNEKEGIAMGDPTEGCISVIITRDGGETWNKIPCEQLPTGREGEAAFAASDTNIKLLGNHVWIATGGKSSRIFHSSDKGKSWSVVETPVIQGLGTTGMYSVDFADEMKGFAIGGDYTQPEGNKANKLITADGGKSWKLIADGKNPGYRSCIQYVPGSSGQQLVAIGFKGIDVSNDGGENWQHLSDDGYYTIRIIDAKTAIAAGAGKVSKLHFLK